MVLLVGARRIVLLQPLVTAAVNGGEAIALVLRLVVLERDRLSVEDDSPEAGELELDSGIQEPVRP